MMAEGTCCRPVSTSSYPSASICARDTSISGMTLRTSAYPPFTRTSPIVRNLGESPGSRTISMCVSPATSPASACTAENPRADAAIV
jgi:hypothetical protein